MSFRRVIVIGGGLAGMAAAVALESAGIQVTLLEARRTLGGRAGSFDDPETGEQLDNCQHVLLGCCTNLIDFYRRIGAAGAIRFDRAIHFRDQSHRHCELSGLRGVGAPLHLGASLMRFSLLSTAEKVHLARAMMAMLRMGRSGRAKLADVAFGEWLDEQRQPTELVRKLYDPVLISGLNEETRRVSASYAIQVFQESLLANEAGYVVGVPRVPLGELYRQLPCADVRVGCRVGELLFEGNRFVGVRTVGGDVLNADAVVIATARQALGRWIPAQLAAKDERFASLEKLEDVPILGAHLWFDRAVLKERHVALVDGPLQWVFRKDAEGCAVHGVISAARKWVEVPREEMLEQFTQQVRRTFPGAANAKLVRGRIIVEKRATFSPVPGVDRWRPGQGPSGEGRIGNLFLAGDYTRTGWPATMEGAVRSGYLAAGAVCSSRSFLVGDLPIQWPARLMGLR